MKLFLEHASGSHGHDITWLWNKDHGVATSIDGDISFWMYHIKPYFEGIFPYIGFIYGRYLQFRCLKWPLIFLFLIVSPALSPYPRPESSSTGTQHKTQLSFSWSYCQLLSIIVNCASCYFLLATCALDTAWQGDVETNVAIAAISASMELRRYATRVCCRMPKCRGSNWPGEFWRSHLPSGDFCSAGMDSSW
jgi:hypothetical protein